MNKGENKEALDADLRATLRQVYDKERARAAVMDLVELRGEVQKLLTMLEECHFQSMSNPGAWVHE